MPKLSPSIWISQAVCRGSNPGAINAFPTRCNWLCGCARRNSLRASLCVGCARPGEFFVALLAHLKFDLAITCTKSFHGVFFDVDQMVFAPEVLCTAAVAVLIGANIDDPHINFF